jgi:hypothetical protein
MNISLILLLHGIRPAPLQEIADGVELFSTPTKKPG